ncbi:MAG: hypothetical protein LBK98_08400, partial [Peptococcaceae bacterium]|nr:hypothetical protein [Peptococcaceae bacterium]
MNMRIAARISLTAVVVAFAFASGVGFARQFFPDGLAGARSGAVGDDLGGAGLAVSLNAGDDA